MIPESFMALVAEGSGAGLTIIVRSIAPVRFWGSDLQVETLVRDLNCLDGCPWRELDCDGHDNEGDEAPDMLPWEVVSWGVADVTPEEAELVMDNLGELILRAQEAGATGADTLPFQDYLDALRGPAQDFHLAPPILPPEWEDRPAWEWAIRRVDIRLAEAPDRELLELREREWWPSWA